MAGYPHTGSSGLGSANPMDPRRVERPAARIIACMAAIIHHSPGDEHFASRNHPRDLQKIVNRPSAKAPICAKMHPMLGTIGLFLRSNDNDYQQRLKEVGLREAKKQGFEIVIESAQNDASRQVEQIHAAIKNAANTKLAAILVSTVRDDVLPDMVREAAEAGIDWALLNEGTFIDEIRRSTPTVRSSW